MNNLDPKSPRSRSELVVYGGIGRAARDWESFDRIVATLARSRRRDAMRAIRQAGRGVSHARRMSPRVLIANSNLVPHWATLDHFNELDRMGLMMYGQMTAGSWIYIGTPGHRTGNLRDLRGAGAAPLRRQPRSANGFSPPGSAAWAARSRSPPPWRVHRCLRSNANPHASRCGSRPAISTTRQRTRRGAGDDRARLPRTETALCRRAR